MVDYRVITTAFVDFVTDQLQTETSVFGDFKYHDSGVDTTDPAITDTAIETTDGENRATGTQTESAHNIYQSVGTISYTTSKAITEHGLFNDASAGTLMDRSEFAAINAVNGDSIQFTYSLTLKPRGLLHWFEFLLKPVFQSQIEADLRRLQKLLESCSSC